MPTRTPISARWLTSRQQCPNKWTIDPTIENVRKKSSLVDQASVSFGRDERTSTGDGRMNSRPRNGRSSQLHRWIGPYSVDKVRTFAEYFFVLFASSHFLFCFVYLSFLIKMIVDRSHSCFGGRSVHSPSPACHYCRALSFSLFHSSILSSRILFFKHSFFKGIPSYWTFDIFSWKDHTRPIYQKCARRKKNETEHYHHHNHHVGDRSRANGT
jgi:hypothetical protein